MTRVADELRRCVRGAWFRRAGSGATAAAAVVGLRLENETKRKIVITNGEKKN